jgi:hypothetical protein
MFAVFFAGSERYPEIAPKLRAADAAQIAAEQ